MPWSDPEVRAEYHKKYYAENKQKWRETVARRTPAQKAHAAKFMRNYALKKKYGIDDAEYQKMYAEQHGNCAICGRHSSVFKAKLHVDHCHSTGKVRRLLCVKCNMALGWYETFSNKITEYLAK